MTAERRGYRTLMRVAAVMLIGLGMSACSTVPTWVDPTTWMGPDVPDQADNGQYPDLSQVPDRPADTSTSTERRNVANSLAAARSDVQYSADALRGGTEAAAAPPPPAAPARTPVATAETNSEPASQPAAAKPAARSAPVTQVATAAEPPPTPAPQPMAAEPAVPAVPATASSGVPGAQPAVPAVSNLGFQASKAPPLDASVAQFVAQPIIARYAQTAPVGGPAVAAVPDNRVALRAPRGTRRARTGTGDTDVGGPESMGGAVVADLSSLQASSSQPSVYAGVDGMPPVAVVLFPGDTSGLTAAGRKAVKEAAEAYRSRGGQGFVRVVGHSSSHTGNMSMVRHMEVNFAKSQARARAVARQLIKDGVPADKVLVDAVGDAQPVYHESMPRGEDGNRRAEIYLQG